MVDEPVRFLTFQFLRDTSAASVASAPLILDVANKLFSPIRAALQYLSSLLHSDNGRLRLIYEGQGFESVGDWEVEAEPAQLRLLRRMVLLVSSWIQARHQDRLGEPPFSLVGLVDSRLTSGDREALLQHWDGSNGCCLRPGLARTLKQR